MSDVVDSQEIPKEARKSKAKGGHARAASLSKERRTEIAQNAARRRWIAKKATHEGVLKIGEISLACAVLEDGTRVLSQTALTKGLGASRSGSHWRRMKEGTSADLPVFLSAPNLRPFIDNDLASALKEPVLYAPAKGGYVGYGVDAKLIPRICDVFLKARDNDALKLGQYSVAAQADIIVRGLATVGIVALVDEATGYQSVRSREALEKILEEFISKELLKWTKMFPDEFYEEIFRLKGWNYKPFNCKRPATVGKLTNDVVYDRIAPGVLDQLKKVTPRNEKGRLKHKYHQRLTEDVGHPRLREHLWAVISIMKIFDNWEDFYKALQRSLPKQIRMPLFDKPEDSVTGLVALVDSNSQD